MKKRRQHDFLMEMMTTAAAVALILSGLAFINLRPLKSSVKDPDVNELSAESKAETAEGVINGAGRDFSPEISTKSKNVMACPPDSSSPANPLKTRENEMPQKTAPQTGEKEEIVFFDSAQDEVTPSMPEIDPVAAALAQTMWAEARGLPDDERSAVAWCVLNRVDSDMYPDTVMENLTAPAQFAYWPDAPVTDDLYALALDVLSRWERERAGETDVGRTLPREYLFFEGDGRHNYFSTAWRGGEYWSFGGEEAYGESD